MPYRCISVLSVLATVPLGSLAKLISQCWNDMHIKHSWNAVPENWESLGCQPSGTTIDFYIALKSHRQNDITSGSNLGCNTNGFSAIAGWCFVTGLGTPGFEPLLDILDQPDPSNPAKITGQKDSTYTP